MSLWKARNQEFVSVDSGVSQGTAIIFITDLPQSVRSSVHRRLSLIQDSSSPSRPWFPERMGVSMGHEIQCLQIQYHVPYMVMPTHNQILYPGWNLIQEVNQAKYLGVIRTWLVYSHIAITTNKANSTIGFLRSKLKYCPRSLKGAVWCCIVDLCHYWFRYRFVVCGVPWID